MQTNFDLAVDRVEFSREYTEDGKTYPAYYVIHLEDPTVPSDLGKYSYEATRLSIRLKPENVDPGDLPQIGDKFRVTLTPLRDAS